MKGRGFDPPLASNRKPAGHAEPGQGSQRLNRRLLGNPPPADQAGTPTPPRHRRPQGHPAPNPHAEASHQPPPKRRDEFRCILKLKEARAAAE